MFSFLVTSVEQLRAYQHNRPVFWILIAFISVVFTYAICYMIDKKKK